MDIDSPSREAYQVPETSGALNPFDDSAAAIPAPRAFSRAEESAAMVKYSCGDCSLEQPLERGGQIRCVSCGCRIFYKLRTARMVQFEAR